MSFFNRKPEIETLSGLYRLPAAQFITLYGRRRIGKTALLQHWTEKVVKTDSLYLMARRSSSHLLLQEFSAALGRFMGLADTGFAFSDWNNYFLQLGKIAERKRIVVVIDEFPYLVESVPEISGILQRAWDLALKRTKLFLAVSGSHYHMMIQEFTAEKRPLFGRTTGQIFLNEITPDQLHFFLPRYGANQIVETYSVIGGVPKYLEMWDDSKPVLKNIADALLSPVTLFRQEPMFLIQDEIAEPRTYLAILEALGRGALTPKDISIATGIALSHIGNYLQTLLVLKFIRKIISLTAEDPNATRMSHYEICDPYLRFYFRFIHPNLSLLEQNRNGKVVELIEQGFNNYAAQYGFEEICRRHVIKMGDKGNLPFCPENVGRLWNKQAEIDVVAINKKEHVALVGECKWTQNKTGEEVLNGLIAKTRKFPQFSSYKFHYALFSKAGFSKELYSRQKREGIFLLESVQNELLKLSPS